MSLDGSKRSKLYLISGGCRSGKSKLALQFASSCAGRRVFLATAEARDKEMRDRIQRHQLERQQNLAMDTYEQPLANPSSIAAIGTCDFLLFDCLTLWVANLLGRNLPDEAIFEELDCLLTAMRAQAKISLIVSNEVGMGIVPENKLARRYRDIIGFCHQKIADQADECYLAMMGQALALKRLTALCQEDLHP